MDRKEFIITIIVTLFSLVVAFAAGYLLHGVVTPPELELPILSEARRVLLDNALNDPPPDPALEYGMIHGLVQAFGDPYTVFVEPQQHELDTNRLEGKYGGIGVQLNRDTENFIIMYPFPQGPAIEAGIQDGDRLVKVDDTEITPETSFETVQSLVRGPEGQRVRITVTRPPNYDAFEFNIRRQDIPLPSVTWHLAEQDPRLGVVEVNIIADSTPDEILTAVEDLQSQGASHFAIDLRGNGGGLLDAGVDIARLFLQDGVVIQQQYRDRNVETFRVTKKGPLADLPIVILVDHNTASASEIIAGSLQARGRAILIGAPTFGKDTVQLIFDLQDESSIHVTAGRWWIPGWEFPKDDGGLTPDIPIPPDMEGADPAVDLAVREFFGS